MTGYSKYKYSGFSWIGDIPEHWEVKRTKYVAAIYNGDSLNDDQKNAYTDFSESDDTLPYIASKDIDKDSCSVDYLNGTRIPRKEKNTNGRPFAKAPTGSSLLCIEGGSAGKKRCIIDREVNFVNKLCCFVPKINGRFLFYYICSHPYWENFKQNIQGMIGGVTVTKLATFPIPVPSDEEQNAIADYLDIECQKIDILIAREEKRISLLNEVKRSIITRAVTKGVEGGVVLKDSGIYWIGQIPSHWTMNRIKYIASIHGRIGYKGYTTADLVSEGEGAYTIGGKHISKNLLDLSDPEYIDWEKYYESPEIMVHKGDIITAQRGTLGRTAFVQDDIGPATINPSLVLINNIKINNEYLYWWMISDAFLSEIAILNTSTAVPMISQSQIANIRIPIPPNREQEEICAYIRKQTKQLDKTIDKVECQLMLLREYRQSLITEVVTGKRKVC